MASAGAQESGRLPLPSIPFTAGSHEWLIRLQIYARLFSIVARLESFHFFLEFHVFFIGYRGVQIAVHAIKNCLPVECRIAVGEWAPGISQRLLFGTLQ